MALDYGTASSFSVRMAGPFGSVGSAVKITEITLLAADWKGAISPYAQTVAMDSVSVNSKVDILLSPAQLEAFRAKELALTTENDGGTVTVYAIGNKPDTDITVQAAITEVTA